MKDVLGRLRINCENLTTEEWELLNFAWNTKEWFTPTDAQWLVVRGVLALIDIRRGYELKNRGTDNESVQFGIAQLKINNHGITALKQRRLGRIYKVGEEATWEEACRVVKEWQH